MPARPEPEERLTEEPLASSPVAYSWPLYGLVREAGGVVRVAVATKEILDQAVGDRMKSACKPGSLDWKPQQ